MTKGAKPLQLYFPSSWVSFLRGKWSNSDFFETEENAIIQINN